MVLCSPEAEGIVFKKCFKISYFLVLFVKIPQKMRFEGNFENKVVETFGALRKRVFKIFSARIVIFIFKNLSFQQLQLGCEKTIAD